ncbi:MAG TPA: transcription antitermination factor NusB [Candidatus Dormibacteraeota bacterium]|nr:transcription antitermination factor NusB [Candidatus Dormibacteraeota bacterium]
MSARRKGRELALQVLYQLDMSGESSEQGLHAFADSFDVSPKAREFAWNLVRGVREQRAEIDAQLAAASENWKLDRLAQIDATVIRIAVYEMSNGLPMEIAINEAVEVARRYGTTESAAFVNGVLDAVAKRLGLERGRKRVESE